MKLPPKVKRKYPEVEWKKMAGLRDVLIHEYFGGDIEIVWDVVRRKIPPLDRRVRQILKESRP